MILPYSLTNIGGGAFRGSKITELSMPDSVVSVGGGAFASCDYLEKVRLSQNLKILSVGIFEYSDAIQELIIPDSVEKICKDALSVDGVRTDVVGAGKTAFGKGKKYKIVYKYMKGVTCLGKRPQKYEYGFAAKMPAAKKKGHVFFGWNWNETRCILDGIGVRYSTEPTMRNCKKKTKISFGKAEGV